MEFSVKFSPLSASAVKAVVTGSLDAGTAIAVEMEMAGHLRNAAVKNVVFDMSGLDFLSSSGLRIFMIILKTVKPRGGNLYIVGAGPTVTGPITMAGLHKLILLRKTMQECAL